MPLDAQLLDRVLNSPQLPSLPSIALQIIELVQEDEADVDTIAETISLDAALSSKILKTVNSSFYGMSKTVGSVHQAVVVLGLNSVKTLALGFTLVQNLTQAGGDQFDHMAYWKRSLYCATASKLICEKLHIVQAEEVFIASLLQDVGMLALAQTLGNEYVPIIRKAEEDHAKLAEAERAAFDGDHTEVGGAIAESWGLPPLLTESIRLHERPDEAPENLSPLIRAVCAGAYVADLIAFSDQEEQVARYHESMESWFNLSGDESESLLREVFQRAGEVQRLFELPIGDLSDPAVILANAKAALERVKAQEDADSASAPAQTPTPSLSQGGLDESTGLPNRRRFDEHLDEQFVRVGLDQPLSVIFVDIDALDSINAEHGRASGDAVLLTVAEALRICVEQQGGVYRYGEDEFTVLCGKLNRSDAALLAEQMRATIELLECTPGDGKAAPIKITASIGVATYDGSVFKRSEQLVKAASKGVHAAKGGGRNIVRVFVPKAA